MSLVDLGKRLLEAAKRGETEEVRTLMSNGAPFTTDWVCSEHFEKKKKKKKKDNLTKMPVKGIFFICEK